MHMRYSLPCVRQFYLIGISDEYGLSVSLSHKNNKDL